jgi:uncharacterized protein (TIGR02271 family)
MATKKATKKPDTNPDPITGEPGSHPLGVGLGTAVGGAAGGAAVGAASSAAAGAALGAVAGPVGAAVGVVAGGILGAVAGKRVAEAIDPTEEDAFWREHYALRPYAQKRVGYDTYRPAYQYGWESRRRYEGRRFEEAEGELRRGWEKTKSKLAWERARPAVRDAWDRVDQRAAGDSGSPQTGSPVEGEQTMKVHEEELRAQKRPVKKGEVRVRKEVVTEHKTLDVPVTREEVVIERRPASGRRAAAAELRPEEIRVPVKEERVRVTKTPVVREEVRVGKRRVHGTERVGGTVRKERVKVEKKGDAPVRDRKGSAKK